MNDPIFLKALELSSSVGSPLAIAGFGLTLFFSTLYHFIKKIDLSKIAKRSIAKILALFITYGFVLSVLALILGVTAWAFAEFYGPAIHQTKGARLLKSQEYEQAISYLRPYLRKNPTDDEVRRLLGKSLFATEKYDEGLKLFQEMLLIYKNKDPCSLSKMSAYAGISAFYLELKDLNNGIIHSKKILHCKNIYDVAMFNYLNMLAQKKDYTFWDIPNNFIFKNSNYLGLHSFLRFVYLLDTGEKNLKILTPHLLAAVCQYRDLEPIVTGWFKGRKIIDDVNLIFKFHYEFQVVHDNLSKDQRTYLLTKIQPENCAV